MCVYLSRPQISLVDTTKSSFAQQFFITEWACCFLHFFECINWWSMASFCRWSLILYLPTFNWFIYPWKRQNQKEKKMKINPEKKKIRRIWRRSRNIHGLLWSSDLLLRRLFQAETRPKGMILFPFYDETSYYSWIFSSSNSQWNEWKR